MKKLREINLKNASQVVIAVLILAIITFAGCQGQSFLDTVFPQENIGPSLPQGTIFPTKPTITNQVSTPLPVSDGHLSIWLPPQFGSDSESEAAELLREHLQNYLDENTEITLEIRVKPASGPGSILEALNSASMVAPEALPSLVLISRNEMIQAASKNLIFPIEGLTEAFNDNDFFDISRALGTYQGTIFCLPFAVDAIGLVQRNTGITTVQLSWDEAYRQSERILFAAGDSEALITLALYQSAGGEVQDKAGQPIINTDRLTTVLAGYDNAARSRRIPLDVLEYQTDDQVWDAFQLNTRGSALTWASHALKKLDVWNLALLPGFNSSPVTLATGWMWCLVEPHDENKKESVRLAEKLIDPDFLNIWAPVSGFLPVRPSSISGYSNIEVQDTITKMLQSALVKPEKSLTSEIGPELKTAISEVLQKINSPELSALNAEKRLEVMRSQ